MSAADNSGAPSCMACALLFALAVSLLVGLFAFLTYMEGDPAHIPTRIDPTRIQSLEQRVDALESAQRPEASK